MKFLDKYGVEICVISTLLGIAFALYVGLVS